MAVRTYNLHGWAIQSAFTCSKLTIETLEQGWGYLYEATADKLRCKLDKSLINIELHGT